MLIIWMNVLESFFLSFGCPFTRRSALKWRFLSSLYNPSVFVQFEEVSPCWAHFAQCCLSHKTQASKTLNLSHFNSASVESCLLKWKTVVGSWRRRKGGGSFIATTFLINYWSVVQVCIFFFLHATGCTIQLNRKKRVSKNNHWWK